ALLNYRGAAVFQSTSVSFNGENMNSTFANAAKSFFHFPSLSYIAGLFGRFFHRRLDVLLGPCTFFCLCLQCARLALLSASDLHSSRLDCEDAPNGEIGF